MCWSPIVPWLFKLCAVSSDILRLDCEVQLNWMNSLDSIETNTHRLLHKHTLPYFSSYLSDSSWLCPPPSTPLSWTPAALLSPLFYALTQGHFLSPAVCSASPFSLPQLWAFLSLDLWCDEWHLIKWMLGLITYMPASATCMCFEM